jgi:uncharacterized protein YuzE
MAVMADEWLRLIPQLREVAAHAALLEYDEHGDVLYVTFEPDVAADESYEVAEDVIGRFKDKRVIGYTMLNASQHGFAD